MNSKQLFCRYAGSSQQQAYLYLQDRIVPKATELELELQRLRGLRTDQAAWLARHDEVHDRLCRTSGRMQLEAECRRYRLAVQPYVRLYLNSGRTFEQPGVEHDHLIEALRSGVGERAERAERAERMARSHIMAIAEAIAECLKHGPAVEPLSA